MSWNQVRQWAMVVKRDVCAVYLASRDPRVPWYAKVVAVLVAAYALSPIDLIPDFIPVIGYLDDLLLIPFGILLVIRLVPQELMAEHRLAATKMETLPKSWGAVVAIIILWMTGIIFTMWLFTKIIIKNSY
ncbi:YkvA family protein [Candidatus Nitrospira salsa]|nr:MAG: membrane protein [Nitrospirales bacterium]